MLKRCILAENRKLHASPIWAMFFVLPVLPPPTAPSIICKILRSSPTAGIVCGPSTPLFYSMLFFPAMVATYAAYLWRLEHLGTTGTSSWQAPCARWTCLPQSLWW